MALQVRHMQVEDVPDILHLQTLAYPGILHERAEFFLNRLALSSQTCWVAREANEGRLLGYLVAYPWDDGLPPSLDVLLPALPATAPYWFLHDCAVHPVSQGLGVGRQLYEVAVRHARSQGMQRARLVALAQAAAYWQGLGYGELSVLPSGLSEKLAAYGQGAQYLERTLD